jgi:hypothetical protein
MQRLSSMRVLKFVDDFRAPLLASAANHPINAVPMIAVGLILMLVGLPVVLLGVALIDFIVLVGVLQIAAARRHLIRRNLYQARERAARTLGPGMRSDWDRVLALVERAQGVSGRRRDLDGMLTTYLNLAMARKHAGACIDASGGDGTGLDGAPDEALLRRWSDARGRGERAVELLATQLTAMGQLIHLECELSMAEQCESAAELWASDVRDSVGEKALEP